MEMITQLLLVLALTAVTVVIHAVGAARVVLPLSGIWRENRRYQVPTAVVPIIRVVSGLLLLHLIEMCVWGGTFFAFGVFANFETSLYYSLTSYTTVGYGDVIPPVEWRLLGPLEAAVGVLMLGVSTGIIVAGVERVYARLESL